MTVGRARQELFGITFWQSRTGARAARRAAVAPVSIVKNGRHRLMTGAKIGNLAPKTPHQMSATRAAPVLPPCFPKPGTRTTTRGNRPEGFQPRFVQNRATRLPSLLQPRVHPVQRFRPHLRRIDMALSRIHDALEFSRLAVKRVRPAHDRFNVANAIHR